MTLQVAVRKKERQLNWIIEYLKEHKRTNVMDSDFIDAFVKKFDAKVQIMMFGANRCTEAGKALSFGYNKGILTRSITGIPNGAWHLGFPKWVYVYELRVTWKSTIVMKRL